MFGRISPLLLRAPRALLLASVLVTTALAAWGADAPLRLAAGGGAAGDTESSQLREALTKQLGYDPEAFALLVLNGHSSTSPAATRVATETISSQLEGIDGVGAVLDGGSSADGRTSVLELHAKPEAGSSTLEAATARFGEIDPGSLTVHATGPEPIAEAARATASDDGLRLELLGLPLIALLLVGSLGLRLGLSTLLGALGALGAGWALLSIANHLVAISALALVAAAIVSIPAAVDVAAVLTYRYREESATLGAGNEALEYSLHTVARGMFTGLAVVALIGLTAIAIPIDDVQSIGAGLLAAALAVPLALIPITAMLSLRATQEVGTELPLLADSDRPASAPLAFRALLGFGRSRRRAALAIPALVVIVALALPLLNSRAIGLDASQLSPDEPAAKAAATLDAAFGPGAAGPLIVAAPGPPTAPTLTIYRDAISRLVDVETVERASAAGKLSSFEADPAARPLSLGAQDAARHSRTVEPAPPGSLVGGQGAELLDAGERLGSALPLAALASILGAAALWSLVFRAGFGPLLAALTLAAPLAGLGAMQLVFAHGRLSGPLDYQPAGAPHLLALAIVAITLLAVSAGRGATFANALREERVLGAGAAGSLARSGLLTLMPAAIATIVSVVAAGVWLGSDLLPAKEVGLGVAAGLLADLLLVRAIAGPALARATLSDDPPKTQRGEEAPT